MKSLEEMLKQFQIFISQPKGQGLRVLSAGELFDFQLRISVFAVSLVKNRNQITIELFELLDIEEL